jgi:hypothetical protein
LGCSYKLDWVPSLGNVMETLQVYGYLGVSDSGGLETSTNSEIEGTSEEQGPPMNLFSLLKFLSVFIATRLVSLLCMSTYQSSSLFSD